MTPIEKDKIVALCEKWKLKELNFTKGVYIAEDNSGITVNLRGDHPIVGVTIAGTLHIEGHGNLKVQDYQCEIEAILKSSKKSQSSSTDKLKNISNIADLQSAGKPERSNRDATPSKLGTPDTLQSSSTEPKGTEQGEQSKSKDSSKLLGTPDNIAPPAKVASLIASGEPETQGNKTADSYSAGATTLFTGKLQKAKCKYCGIEFELTLDEAQKIFKQYDGIYCMKCRSKKTKNEKKEGDNKAMETKIKTCISCGLELSGSRALKCFQIDPQNPIMMCEDCEEKTKIKGDIKMDEKLPTTINENENKLTVNIIKQYICPTATDAEAYNFLQLCVHRDLNPFLKEAYLIKYGTAPATMVVGKDAFTKKAEESGKLDGFEAGIIVLNKDKQVERRVGVVQYEGDTLVGGWAKVFRKDMKYPFVCEVPLTEYLKYKDGKPQSSWATLPGTMIRKVALVQSLREAFTAELGGCYDAVEMEAQDNIK